MKYALIDMGSNSIRLTAYDIEQKSFKILFREKIMAGLAGYVEKGALTQEGMDCACDALREFQNTLDLLHIEHRAVFATASLRNVSNTSQALEQLRLTTGISVEVLSGELEAEYGFHGAACDVNIRDGLFVDIGGASTELALFTEGKLQRAGSVPVGSLRMYRDCVKKILPGKASQQRIEEALRKAFAGEELGNIPQREHMVCVGGTARACLKLCRKLHGLPKACRQITQKQLDTLAQRLCKGDKAAAELILRYEPERIHTLVPGLMILRNLTERFGVQDITVSQYGVREGYLHQRILPSLAEQP